MGAWLDAHPGFDVDGRPGSGTTALAHAASGGSRETVRLLLERGADVTRVSTTGANALHYATFKMHRHVAELLLRAPGAQQALAARGSSALWASLGAVTPEELARFNVAAATEFVEALSHSARGDPLRDV